MWLFGGGRGRSDRKGRGGVEVEVVLKVVVEAMVEVEVEEEVKLG